MIDVTRAEQQPQDEPDLLRDQFRQLIRYRSLLVVGLLIGLLGGAYLAFSGADTYTATSELRVRAAIEDPFVAGATADKNIDIGTERQSALSSTVADAAAKATGAPVTAMSKCLQVTNPPNTLVLRFTCTAASAQHAADWVNAFTKAYLDDRQAQTKATVARMVTSYQAQLDPMVTQRNDLLDQIAHAKSSQVVGTLVSSQTNLLSRITELNANISGLRALDTTPGLVIKPGVPPAAPSGPGLPMMLGLGVVVGVALGLLLAWVRLVFDPTVRSDGEVTRTLGAPVLGTLPRLRGRALAGTAGGGLLAGGRGDGRLAEEYRAVAFRLTRDKRFSERRRLLVVAPRGTGETPAAVAVNLAASFAEMGMEVLLVEADLRTPALSARLRTADGARPGWARTPGLGEGGWPAGLQMPIDAGESGSFDLVPGRRVRNVARALTSASAGRLFAEADEPGSVVVVLAPPVLAYADAVALADRVDGVVVVCDPRAVHRADLERVRELIDAAGAAVLGVVLHSSEDGNGRRFGFARWSRPAAPAAPAARPDGDLPQEATTAPERHPVP
ncbi:lipopolysaccharide biosynthesis protein [Actinacidiphila paucisporea]|uniref:Chromosome partitioning ATPase, Mrp family, contains Fe-S cluster n=1 Tax=Actinacidiphila paucisporea TaxID=310782 RepID=A0A1M6XUS2_9ACTN|nr:lipopolysaccharide biosynthesis protein [Actinacidiphila paucisporea]SHL09741.1 Chromosome partitioning ATPase, Mrp family, contains Fe-S cluster [Actinacidiphila paucisporea]